MSDIIIPIVVGFACGCFGYMIGVLRSETKLTIWLAQVLKYKSIKLDGTYYKLIRDDAL